MIPLELITEPFTVQSFQQIALVRQIQHIHLTVHPHILILADQQTWRSQIILLCRLGVYLMEDQTAQESFVTMKLMATIFSLMETALVVRWGMKSGMSFSKPVRVFPRMPGIPWSWW